MQGVLLGGLTWPESVAVGNLPDDGAWRPGKMGRQSYWKGSMRKEREAKRAGRCAG